MLLGDVNGLANVALVEPLVNATRDAEPRVRFHAVLSLGKVGSHSQKAQTEIVKALHATVADNGDSDLYIRAAVAIALSRLETSEIKVGATDASPAVRLDTLLALRRQGSPAVAGFLADTDPHIVVEAARAINDSPIAEGLPQLAAMLAKPGLHENLQYRALNASFRLGKPENAAAVAAFAARSDAPEKLRIEAVKMLGDWAKPSNRDRITGLWQPLSPRDPKIATEALRTKLGGLFASSDKVRQEVTKVAARLGITEVTQSLRSILGDTSQAGTMRAEAMEAMEALKVSDLMTLMQAGLRDKDTAVRIASWRIYAHLDPHAAAARLADVVDDSKTPLAERQAGLAILGGIPVIEDLDGAFSRWLRQATAGHFPDGLTLDLVEAADHRIAAQMRAIGTHGTITGLRISRQTYQKKLPPGQLADYRECLVGGDAAKGRDIFLNKSEVSCVRCHKLNGVGGDVGPELAGIGGKQNREYLLESIVLPDKQIAKGFDTLVLELRNGKTVTGVLKSEDEKDVKLITAEGQPITVAKAQIEERRRGKSAMPEDVVQKLTKREIRDLVEFLAGLK
jgi:quinoprotein glucose dehydrogenase